MHMSITTSFSNIQYSSPFLYDKFSLLLKCWLYFTSLDILNIHSFSYFLYVLFSFQGSLKFSHLSSYFLCLFICEAEKGRERERNRRIMIDHLSLYLLCKCFQYLGQASVRSWKFNSVLSPGWQEPLPAASQNVRQQEVGDGT